MFLFGLLHTIEFIFYCATNFYLLTHVFYMLSLMTYGQDSETSFLSVVPVIFSLSYNFDPPPAKKTPPVETRWRIAVIDSPWLLYWHQPISLTSAMNVA